MLRKIITFSALSLMGLMALSAKDHHRKMYIDTQEFSADTEGDAFHVHIGGNVWLVTNTVHRDSTGMFAYECSLNTMTNGYNAEIERKWKCPYCYQYWPEGKPCGNKSCPSKYK